MSKLSRRALVASAYSLPALAIPAASLAAPANPRDREAIFARAEQIVVILSDRFVCAGWSEQFDTNRAASFLEAVRQEDHNADSRDEAGEFVHAWMIDHGQSFDWLYLGNPAGLIAGAAHRAFPTSPTGEDPILPAIEAHRRAFIECEQCGIDENIARLSNIENDLLCELLEVTPTTLAGVSALSRYSAELTALFSKTGWDRPVTHPDGGRRSMDWSYYIHRSVADAVSKLIQTA